MRTFTPARILLAACAVFCVSQAASERPAAQRGLASCVSQEVAPSFPMSEDWLAQIQDSALRNSTRDFYLYLTQVELHALQGRETIFRQYGANIPSAATAATAANIYKSPTVAPFPFQAAPSASSAGIGFWGSFTLPSAAVAAAPAVVSSAASGPITLGTDANNRTAVTVGSTAQKAPAFTSLPRVVNVPPSFTPFGGRLN